MEAIPHELLNWDQTGIKLVPSSSWTLDRQGVKRVEIAGATDQRLITAVFCGTLFGDFLPLQVIYQGTTDRCHPLQCLVQGAEGHIYSSLWIGTSLIQKSIGPMKIAQCVILRTLLFLCGELERVF